MSRYFLEFKTLESDEQGRELRTNSVWNDVADDESVDSVMTPRSPKPYEIMKLASIHWRKMLSDMVDA